MLDTDTKRKIDNCRDILVGKVPDPKSQVEQITIALIYKFMDDMDREAVASGGKPSFFKGEFKQYAWSNIFDPRLGGFDLIQLYSDALVRMNHNPGIPQLFRDIFKNAFLPYRDPETLKSFLKEINDFTYDHSERLGDAFEYLLSVLGSQGEAGQFRTPRHIIDFMVAVVAPQKNETVLDPACGTAGFLISAYKYILAHEDKLSHAQRKRLLGNFTGYDISPDMVRLSLVNLYLHGFPSPNIHEYDTLTSEKRWNEKADVILANPPFMTPKGGIRPHKRFSIAANRSEVLFVDYIAEHLNPAGRAGVIVPEGIIFQSATAYKALRKMLVDTCLWAVVSLPAGVFNPYAGVKTSILLLDRTLAKKADSILFVKIENDGFGLGAQRREVQGSDLPPALEYCKHYKLALSTGKALHEADFAHVVKKEEIAASGDYNLTGERYRKFEHHAQSEWPIVKIGDLCELQNGRAFKPSDWEKKEEGGLPIIRIQNLNNPNSDFNYYSGKVDNRLIVHRGDLLFSWSGSRGTSFGPHIWTNDDAILNQHIFNVRHKDIVDRQFFYWMLKKAVTQVEENLHGGVGLVHITKGNLENIKIPLPPLEVQEKIVAEIEGYQIILDAARQIVETYKPTIKINPDWPMVRIEEVADINKETVDPVRQYNKHTFVYIDISSVENVSGTVNFQNLIVGIDAPSRARRQVHQGDILLSTVRPNLKAFAYLSQIPSNAVASTGFAVLTPGSNIVGKYLYEILFSDTLQEQMVARMGKGSYPSINQQDVQELRIPLPPLEEQKIIAENIETEQEIINANKKLITIFENKIQTAIADVWGKSSD